MALCHSVAASVQFEFDPFSLSCLSCLYCSVIPKGELRLSLFPFSILIAFIYCLALLITHPRLHSFDCIMLPGLRVTDEQDWKLFQLPKRIIGEGHFCPFILIAIVHGLHHWNILGIVHATELLPYSDCSWWVWLLEGVVCCFCKAVSELDSHRA